MLRRGDGGTTWSNGTEKRLDALNFRSLVGINPALVSARLPVSPSPSWRIFCAIELPLHIRSRLEDHARQLRDAIPDTQASWSRAENIHLTLKFFGDVTTERVAGISSAASRTVNAFSPFEIKVGGTGVFPKPAQARVLWIGVNDPSGQLTLLQQNLEREFEKEGFVRDDREFKAHLTIARLRSPNSARLLAEAHLTSDFEELTMVVRELVVFRSELSSEGSKYSVISRHELSL